MNAKTAEALLACYRTGKPMDARVVKAARTAEEHPILRDRLSEQMGFDEQVVAAVHFVQPPENLRQKLTARGAPAAGGTPVLGKHLGHPAILCAFAGVLLIVGFLTFQEIERRDKFPGKESVERMLAIANDMSGVELEPTQLAAAELGDLFYMRGFEGYALPGELAGLHAVGTRVFKQNGRPVAQLAVDERDALLYVFRAADFGVELRGESDWRIFTQEHWVAAVRANHGICTMLAFRGGKPEMQDFLATLKR